MRGLGSWMPSRLRCVRLTQRTAARNWVSRRSPRISQRGSQRRRGDRPVHAFDRVCGEISRLVNQRLGRCRPEHGVRHYSTLQHLVDDKPRSWKTTVDPVARLRRCVYPPDLRRVRRDQHNADVREWRHGVRQPLSLGPRARYLTRPSLSLPKPPDAALGRRSSRATCGWRSGTLRRAG